MTPSNPNERPALDPASDAWSALADTPLLRLPFDNWWTIRDAVEGTQVFGATGAGKSSGSGAGIAKRFIRTTDARGLAKPGFGGLVLTVKPDEVDAWRKYAAECGRSDDLVVFGPSTGFQFNFLDYEFNHAGKGSRLTQNIVSLFLSALQTGQGASSHSDPYWHDALREMLTHTFNLAAFGTWAMHGRTQLELADAAEIIRSAPQSPAEILSPGWQNTSRCFELLRAVEQKVAVLESEDAERLQDLEQTAAYWLRDFPSLAQRTRSIIVSSFTSKASGLLQRPLRRMFCSTASEGTDRVRPEETHRGKIIVLNLPVKDYGEVGRFAQLIYKTIWQRATERRLLVGDWRPVFLWADEAQHFVTSEDMLFQQTARSKWAATVYLTQNIPNYHAVLTGHAGGAITDSLLGSLQTKILHANGDPTTNEYGERLFGRVRCYRESQTHSQGGDQLGQSSMGLHESMEPVVPAREFSVLRTGGNANGYSVGAFMFKAGRAWLGPKGTKSTALRCEFNQRERA